MTLHAGRGLRVPPDAIALAIASAEGVNTKMGIFSEIFSWWGGNTWGTRWTIWRKGRQVGSDEFGNRYYLQKRGVGPLGVPRRWVVYQNLAEPSKVPAEWHGWLHYTHDKLPTDETYTARPWQQPHRMNMTGTSEAWRPSGSILAKGERPRRPATTNPGGRADRTVSPSTPGADHRPLLWTPQAE